MKRNLNVDLTDLANATILGKVHLALKLHVKGKTPGNCEVSSQMSPTRVRVIAIFFRG